MDLFEDLPEPGRAISANKSNAQEEQEWDTSAPTMFSGLPPPTVDDDKRNLKRKSVENSSALDIKKPLQTSFELQGFVAERKGEREDMQDRHVIIDDYTKTTEHLHSLGYKMSFYGVFDGHGGSRASRFAAENLHVNLANALSKVEPNQIEKDIKRVMLETFKKTDELFLKEARGTKPTWKDGTTAVSVLALDSALYIANLGDSKAILCRYNKDLKKHFAIPLSKDHSPTEYAERMRIQKAGGYVREGRVMGILEVSRSIGDGQYKMLGVTCVPDVKRCQLTEADSFVLLACDGLWKVFTSEEVLQIVIGSPKGKDEKASEGTLEHICYETACNKLVSEAIRRKSGDNVTVVIVSIKRIHP